MTFQNRLASLALFGFLLAAPATAWAQQTDANCNPVPYDEDRAFTQEICNSHIACRAISKSLDKVCKGVQFLQKLSGKLTQEAEADSPNFEKLPDAQKKNWLQKVFSPDDMADAALPPLTPSKAMTENIAAMDSQFDAPDKKYGKDTFDNGVYEGEMKNGLENGSGVMVFKNGEIQAGHFKDGNLQGEAVTVFADGDVEAGRRVDNQLVSGAHEDGKTKVTTAGIFTPDKSEAIGLEEIDYPNGTSQMEYENKDKVLAKGPLAQPGKEPVDPPEPKGLPPEEARDVPLWSPTSPVGSVMVEEMNWDPGVKLDWDAWSPEDGADPLSNARFCRPLTGKLTPQQAKDCAQDLQTVTTKLKSKDPIGESMFCQPLTGSLPPDMEEACGIKHEPPPRPARMASNSNAGNGLNGSLGLSPAPSRNAPPPQPRVAVAAPPSGGLSLDQYHKNCAVQIEAQRQYMAASPDDLTRERATQINPYEDPFFLKINKDTIDAQLEAARADLRKGFAPAELSKCQINEAARQLGR